MFKNLHSIFNNYQGHVTLIFFYLSVFLELALQTFWRGAFGPYLSPIAWLVAGIVTCLTAMLLMGFQRTSLPVSNDYNQRNTSTLIVLSVTLFSALIIAALLSDIFQRYPSDPIRGSDIVPTIRVLVQRFLSNEKVYAAIPFPTWTVFPGYLPLMWIPYCFSEWFGLDYRWTAYMIFVIAIYLYALKIVRYEMLHIEGAIKALLPFFFLLMFIKYEESVFGYAVELLPVGFYLLLALSIFNRSRFLVGIGILICLLSRYSFIFWLPYYLLVIWIEWGFRDLLRVGFWLLLGTLFLYVFPFWLKDPGIFSKGLYYYNVGALWQWHSQSWQQIGEKPFVLNQGIGFAIYFYDFLQGDLTARFAMNKIAHLIACGLSTMLLFLGYLMFRNHGLNIRIYLLVSLKFYLLIFYGLLPAPFSYLYILPLFLSLPLFFESHMLLSSGAKPFVR